MKRKDSGQYTDTEEYLQLAIPDQIPVNVSTFAPEETQKTARL